MPGVSAAMKRLLTSRRCAFRPLLFTFGPSQDGAAARRLLSASCCGSPLVACLEHTRLLVILPVINSGEFLISEARMVPLISCPFLFPLFPGVIP